MIFFFDHGGNALEWVDLDQVVRVTDWPASDLLTCHSRGGDARSLNGAERVAFLAAWREHVARRNAPLRLATLNPLPGGGVEVL